MCRVRVETSPGLVDSEVLARIETISGEFESLFVSKQQVHNGYLSAGQIHGDANRVLIELPREAFSGNWRVWVPRSSTET